MTTFMWYINCMNKCVTVTHITEHNLWRPQGPKKHHPPMRSVKNTSYKHTSSQSNEIQEKTVKLKIQKKTYREFVVCQRWNRVVWKINCFHKTRNSCFYAVQPFIRTCCAFKTEPCITSTKYRAPIVNTFYNQQKL